MVVICDCGGEMKKGRFKLAEVYECKRCGDVVEVVRHPLWRGAKWDEYHRVQETRELEAVAE